YFVLVPASPRNLHNSLSHPIASNYAPVCPRARSQFNTFPASPLGFFTSSALGCLFPSAIIATARYRVTMPAVSDHTVSLY
ncbi:MAG: hypothetical protein ACXWMS_09250, partial [Syntrophales bacterium]